MEFSLYSIYLKGFLSKSYEVHNENTVVLTAKKTTFFGLGDFDIMDVNNKVVLSIRRPIHLWKTKFELIENGIKVAEVVPISFSKSYEMTYGDTRLEATGNFFNTVFTIKDGEKEIAKITRDVWGKDPYKVGLMQGYNELYVLAMIICISIIIRLRNNG